MKCTVNSNSLREDMIMTEDSRYLLKTLLYYLVANYPSLAPDKYFEIFSAHQALKARHFNPDPTEIQSGIVGGDGDGGVDGFYLFVNKKFIREDTDPAIFKDQQINIEVVIVQGKNKASFEESVPYEIERFYRALSPPKRRYHIISIYMIVF